MKEPRSRAAKTVRRLDAVFAAISTAMLLVCAGMIGWGFFAPDGPTVKPKAEEPTFTAIAPGDPERLLVPSLDIDAPIVPIELTSDQVLNPPSDPQEVGWWDISARPGANDGQTVITGHTVHTGGGALDDLPTIDDGEKVAIVTPNGTMHYEVKGTAVLNHKQVAKYAQNLFAQNHGDGRLILVTCTDWNGEFYRHNAIVLAEPLGQLSSPM